MVILWYGARLVVLGHMTAGDLSAFVLYVVFVGSSVGGIAGTLSQLIQAVRCAVLCCAVLCCAVLCCDKTVVWLAVAE